MTDVPLAFISALHSLDALAQPAVWSLRNLAACAATFVLFNWLKYRGSDDEIPPYNRRANETAWAMAAIGAILGGVGFNSMDVYWISTYAMNAPNVMVAGVWGFWGLALTRRAAARSMQPNLLYLAGAIIVVGSMATISIGGPGVT